MRRTDILNQLHAISCRIESLEGVIGQETSSIRIIRKIHLIQADLRTVALQLLEEQLCCYVINGVESRHLGERKEIFKEIANMLVTKYGQVKTTDSKEVHMTTVTYLIPSINCGGCKRRLENWLGRIQGVQSAVVNVSTKQVVIAYGDPATEESIKNFLVSVNYPVQASEAAGPSINRE